MKPKPIMFVREGSQHPMRHLLLGMLLVVLSILMLTKNIRADGGSVLCQSTSGSIVVTAFSTQSPVRVGRSDISFLVEDAADKHPILDAQVFVELENESGTSLRAEATREQARNKLLYCALIDLPAACHWMMKIIVKHSTGQSVSFHHLPVAAGQPTLLAHWKLLIFPPLLTFLFITNQWLRRSRA